MSGSTIHIRTVNPEVIHESQKVFVAISGTLYTVATLALVLILLLGIKNCCVNVFNKGKSAVSKININTTSTVPEAVSSVPPEEAWKTFNIPAEGLRVRLGSVWQDEVIGGKITITNPRGQVYHDKPGANYNLGVQPEGIYIFRADPPGAKRQVRIKGCK